MTPEDRAQLIADIVAAMSNHSNCLSTDEQQWVRLAIIKQEQSIALRQAIIEKSVTGLVWSAFVGLGYLIVDFAKQHGMK